MKVGDTGNDNIHYCKSVVVPSTSLPWGTPNMQKLPQRGHLMSFVTHPQVWLSCGLKTFTLCQSHRYEAHCNRENYVTTPLKLRHQRAKLPKQV